MPCYTNTIVKVKHVRRNEKEDKVPSVWIIGTYSVGRESNEIEATLFLPINSDERDPKSQAIFKRDEYYSIVEKIIPVFYAGKIKPKMTVATSTHIAITDKVDEASGTNKCPLKVSLVGVPKEMPTEIENSENSVIETLISDYVRQSYNYTVKVIFPHVNSRFKHLKTSIRPQELIIFVVGQMEIINDKFYIYANDINYIETPKKKELNDTELASANPTQSKLLHIHQNITKNLEENPKDDTNSLKQKRSEEIIDPEATEPIKSDDIKDEPKTSESVQLEQESESESESGKKQKKSQSKGNNRAKRSNKNSDK